MQQPWSVRLCVILLMVCLLWVIVGAPVFYQEWQALPDALHRILWQWPVKLKPVLQQWLLRSMDMPLPDTGHYTIKLWTEAAQQTVQLPLEDYVLGVVAAEMPAQYQVEALKCQAVAARTRAVYNSLAMSGSGCHTHPDHDVCIDAACCQGYMDKRARYERWGDVAGLYENQLRQAVANTAGVILTWDSMPAEMLYHACSGGMTEDAAHVFSQAVPYLVSVKSPGEETYSGYAVDIAMSCEEAADRLNDMFPECKLTTNDIPGLLRLQSTTESGRIKEILVGSVLMKGTQFRQALGLRSTLCTWDADNGIITFHTRGYGHGVGMSQAGAQAMALSGNSYRQILDHYYPGTILVTLPGYEQKMDEAMK